MTDQACGCGAATVAECLHSLGAIDEPEPGCLLGDRPFSLEIREFISKERPTAVPLILDRDGRVIVAQKSLTLFGGIGGSGKTTLFTELALHLAAGADYLCFRIPEPVSVLLIENEGPEEMFAEKLKTKLATFPHKLQARVGVCTIDWGGFTLGDAGMRVRLEQDIEEHGYQLIFGDPLDSLGMEGVGSPADTRVFMDRMKATGLHRNVAWWLNTHPRKEETKEALNEIAGAWGGKPDTVMLLKQLDDDRSQIRFPKLRWAKRGRRQAILLGFDADTETFTFISEEGEEERDYVAEIRDLLQDGKWRTAKEISLPKKNDAPGIGANADALKLLLAQRPDLFESRTGDAAKAVGRSVKATVWHLREQLTQTRESVESVEGFASEDDGTDSLTPLYRESEESGHFTPRNGTDSDVRVTHPENEPEDAGPALWLDDGDEGEADPALEADPGPGELTPLELLAALAEESVA